LKIPEKGPLSKPYKVLYENYFDGKVFQDSTWISICGVENRDILNFEFCEKTTASFIYNSVKYSISAYPSEWAGVKYDSETIFELNDNYQNKKEGFGFNQYACLGTKFYQVTCSHDGRQITLTLDPSAWSKGSTQVGLPAIKFRGLSIKNDSVVFPDNFKGKYVLVDFWATTCGPCIYEINNNYKDLYKKYVTKNFEIIGVADDPLPKVQNFTATNMISWIMIPDPNRKIQQLYRVKILPTLFLIDPEGVIIASGNDLRKGKINSLLEKLLETKK
jgi:peroxiredoxin